MSARDGRSAYLRIDSVHQDDEDGVEGGLPHQRRRCDPTLPAKRCRNQPPRADVRLTTRWLSHRFLFGEKGGLISYYPLATF
jgi:hypothetical protein